MTLSIDFLNLLTTNELSNMDAELIVGLLGARNGKSDKLIAQPSNMLLENSNDLAHRNHKEIDPSTIPQDAIYMAKPSNLAGDISTFDFTELKNYIYGVNGRY